MKLESKNIEVLGSKMHYQEAGQGVPILFVHGVPTACQIWNKVMEPLSERARCIAVDLIGLGESDKPEIEYSIEDHIKYLTAFIEALELDQFYIVMHAWGSVAANAYAASHQDKVKGLVFYESYLRPVLDWSMMSLPMQELAIAVAHEDAEEKLVETNYFVEQLLPRAMLDDIPAETVANYKAALDTTERQPLLKYLEELPTGSEPSYVTEIMKDYSHALEKAQMPKLLIYGVPGYNTTISTVAWAKEHLPHLTAVDIGPVLHFAQETNPSVFAQTIVDWLDETAAE